MAAVQQVEEGKEAHDLKRKKVCVSSVLRDVSGSALPAETLISRQSMCSWLVSGVSVQ